MPAQHVLPFTGFEIPGRFKFLIKCRPWSGKNKDLTLLIWKMSAGLKNETDFRWSRAPVRYE